MVTYSFWRLLRGRRVNGTGHTFLRGKKKDACQKGPVQL